MGTVPANPWELRADVQPLELAARRWEEVGTLMARRGDEIVEAARRATEGWDAAAADGYEQHRRQVLADVDRFTALATRIAGSLRAISSILTASQAELDRAWTRVAMVPHDVVGASRHLVFHPAEDDDRGKVASGQREAEEIRRRLTLSLDEETARLRVARTELVTVRTELAVLAGGTFGSGLALGDHASGVGVHSPASRSSSVPGAARSGAGALAPIAPIAPISVSTPDLTGISAADLTPLAAAAAAGAVLGGRRARRTTHAAPPAGGMGAGGMAARAGTMSRGMASGRGDPARSATPKLDGEGDDAARAAREKDAARDATRAALEDKRARRAARRAAREAEQDERDGRDPSADVEVEVDGADAAAAAVTVAEVCPETAYDDAPAADHAAGDGGVVR